MARRIPFYEDLQLRIERDASGTYRVLAFAPEGRTARGSFTPPVTDDELDAFVRGVGLVRRTRRAHADRTGLAKDFGAKLFQAVMQEQVGDVYQAARTAAQTRGNALRITLCLSGAPELMRLPWEFLYKRPHFLSQSIMTPLVRSLDLERTHTPRPVELPLKILGLVSSPTGYDELDADEERGKLEEALGTLSANGLVELHWLETPTLRALERAIGAPDETHVLHYIGHGAYDDDTESGIVVLETERGRPHEVSGEALGAMLQDEDSLRLVVLNSCEGARTSHIDPFSGVAGSLAEFGIPAVIGMQFEITDDAAIAFSDRLYTSLSQGFPVDAALSQARRGIVVAGRETEFATPVLFLRAADARLFDIDEHMAEDRSHSRQVAPVAEAERPPARTSLEMQQVLDAMAPLGGFKKIHFAPAIPAKRLAKLRHALEVPADDEIAVLVDISFWDWGNSAVLFGRRAMYSRQVGSNAVEVPYALLADHEPVYPLLGGVKIGDASVGLEGIDGDAKPAFRVALKALRQTVMRGSTP